MAVVSAGLEPVVMTRRHPAGVFETVVPLAGDPPACDYRLRVTYTDEYSRVVDDPYRYGRILSDYDLYLFSEGTQHRAQEKLGAHVVTVGHTTGVHFAVWAPNAERVSVVGDFNRWDGRVNPMRLLLPSGVWEVFIPDLGRGRALQVRDRGSPTATCSRRPTPTARHRDAAAARRRSSGRSAGYAWRDQEWMTTRRGPELLARPADVDLRGPPGLVGAGARRGEPLPHLPRAGRRGSCRT